MSGRGPRIQSNAALNLAFLNRGSGTEPKIDFPVHDQDPGRDEACVAANAGRRADIPAKEVLNENFEDDPAREICYLGI